MVDILEAWGQYLLLAITQWSPFDDGPSRHEMREERRRIREYMNGLKTR
jgi:hypothetical protein